MMMMDDEQKARTWWAIGYSIVERAMLTFERAPKIFLLFPLIFYIIPLPMVLIDPQWPPWLSTLVYSVLYTCSLVLTTAAATHAVGLLNKGQQPTVGDVFGAIGGAFGPLLATVLVSGVLIFVGEIAVVVPAVVFLFWIIFAGPAAIEEGRPGWSAVQRGRQMAGDARWIQAAMVLGLAFAVRFCIGMLPTLGVQVYLMLSHQMTPILEWAIKLWSWTLDVLTMAFVSCWIATAWFDTLEALKKVRKKREPQQDPPPKSRPPSAPPSAGPSRRQA